MSLSHADFSPPPSLDIYAPDSFQPTYSPFKGERWEVRVAPLVVCCGYWSPAHYVVNMAALMRREPDGPRSWMSMTPMEIESQELGCQAAVGRVVVMGMGMGWAAVNAALRDEVSAVTVVEFDPEVLEFIDHNRVFDQLPAAAAAKISIVNGDAYSYVPDQPADTLLADIWLGLFGAERDAEVRRMRDNTGASRVYFWGQEMVIAHRARQRGLPLDRPTVEAIIAEMDLPLIGPERPDYPEKIAAAAAHWLKEPIA